MKSLIKFAFALAFVIGATNFSFANDKKTAKRTVVSLEQQISYMLGTPDMEPGTEAALSVQFLINKSNEIVVVSVDGEDAKLGNFVRAKLDQQEIEGTQYAINTIYTIPIRFVES